MPASQQAIDARERYANAVSELRPLCSDSLLFVFEVYVLREFEDEDGEN